ncbi:MAG: alpha-1,2-fucosyltransferase [Novipirellula sp. JB048]
MIVIARRYGQLGNRLWLYAHLIAAAAEYGVPVANPCFHEYADLFPSTRDDLWCRYPVISPPGGGAPPDAERGRSAVPARWQRILLAQGVYQFGKTLHRLHLRNYPAHVIRLAHEQTYNLQSDSFRELATSDRHVLVMGWGFRCDSFVEKHAAKIRRHFQLGREHREPVRRCIAEARQRSDIVIGIHIRHGDYATYLNGRYFYELSDYVAKMRQIQAQLSPRRVTFLVCSNAQWNQADFTGLDVQFGPGHLVQDMYALAETDMILGPPSTFTMWASFYGDVPLATMADRDHAIEIHSIAPELLSASSTRRISA